MTKHFLVAVLLLIAGYGCFEAWPLVAGPSLSIDFPLNNTSVPGGIVEVRGRAARAAALTLDGAPVLHDQEGNFSSTLTFPRGGSILTFAAIDRFGRSVTATRYIFVP
ncbi:MAG: hypothetical protein KGH56_02390 [Patescibacteria group bacterium]|nr:hypothetical protein [Patescibacteria group bacterium]